MVCPTQQSKYYRDGQLLKLQAVKHLYDPDHQSLLERQQLSFWLIHTACLVAENTKLLLTLILMYHLRKAAFQNKQLCQRASPLRWTLIKGHVGLVKRPPGSEHPALLRGFLTHDDTLPGQKPPFLGAKSLRTKLPNALTADHWDSLIYSLPQQGHFLVDVHYKDTKLGTYFILPKTRQTRQNKNWLKPQFKIS